MPRVGQVVVFSKVPTASYCTAGEAYRVTHVPKSKRDTYRFERVNGGSATNDPAWAVRQSVWSEAA